MLAGGVIVPDHVNLAPQIAANQRVEEREELLVPMAAETARVDLAAGHLVRSGSIDEQSQYLIQRRDTSVTIGRHFKYVRSQRLSVSRVWTGASAQRCESRAK